MASILETTPARRGPGRPRRSPQVAPTRTLERALSDEKTPGPARVPKRTLSDVLAAKEVLEAKRPRGAQPSPPVAPANVETVAARLAQEREEAVMAGIIEEFCPNFDVFAIPMETRRRLAPLLHRWGKGRVAQILGLWAFLGEGSLRPVSASALQVWGPPGTGKTAIVSDYLNTLKVRHIRLNCTTFTTLGELNARLIDLLRRSTVSAAGPQADELPPALQRSMAVGQQVRSLDKLEAFMRLPLQTLSRTDSAGKSDVVGLDGEQKLEPPVKVVVVIDHAQELPRLGAGAIELLMNLPEVLQWGNQLAIVVISRLRLGSLGLHPNREPPAVAFQAYSEVEAEAALNKVLGQDFTCAVRNNSGAKLAPAAVCSGLMKFAWPHLGRNLQQLLSVGRQLMREGLPENAVGGSCGAAFQARVLRAVQQRLGICDLKGLLRQGDSAEGLDTASVSALVTLRQMTKAEMRLILAAYLAGYVEKEDDIQLFMPEVRRKMRRKGGAKQQGGPVYTRAPKPTSMSRLLAVYHRLARRPQLLGPPIFEHLSGLREAGLLRFPAERACLDQDVKVTCRAQLPLVRAISAELNIDLAEYLTKY